MKKFLGAAIGLVLIGAAVVPFSEASRDAYHAYLYQQSLKKRNRRFAPPKRVITTTDESRRNEGRPVVKNLRYGTQSKRNLFAGRESLSTSKIRPMSNSYRGSQSRFSREEISVRNFDPISLKMQTIVTDEFSVELPEGWTPVVNGKDFVVNAGDALNIKITRMEDVCETGGFQACAIHLSENLNRLPDGRGRIMALSRIIRMHQLNDRHKGSFEQTKTFTESFIGAYPDKEAFITRYFVQNGEGVLYLIEVVSSRNYMSEAVVIARQLFNSFRIIK